MKSKICVSFREKKTYIAGQIPADGQPLYYPDHCARSQMERRLEQTRRQQTSLQQQQARSSERAEWLELGYPAGQLVFACLDIDWSAYCGQIKELLQHYADCRITVNPDLVKDLDWVQLARRADELVEQRRAENTPEAPLLSESQSAPFRSLLQKIVFKKKRETSPASAESAEQSEILDFSRGTGTAVRSIAAGLSEEYRSLYSRLLQLYRKLCTELHDYPAMEDLIRLYCTQCFGDQYTAAKYSLSLANLTEEQREIYVWVEPEIGAASETQKADRMETCALLLLQLLRGCAIENSPLEGIEQAEDRYLSAVAWDLLQLLHDRLKQLAEFQPHLRRLVNATIAVENAQPDECYRAVSYCDGDSYRFGEALRQQLMPTVLPCLSARTDSNPRKLPELLQLHFAGDHFAGFVMMEWEQMCMQRIPVRPCEFCGKLFIPFSSNAKYCTRTAPGEPHLICRDAAARMLSANAAEDPWKKRYNQLANSFNLQLTRAGYPDERKKAVMKSWHESAKPLLVKLISSSDGFDQSLMDDLLGKLFSSLKIEEAKMRRKTGK